MRNIFLLVLLSILFSCTNEVMDKAVSVSVEVREYEPASVVIKLQGSAGVDLSVEMYNVNSGKIEHSFVINGTVNTQKYLVANLKPGVTYRYKVLEDKVMVTEGEFELPVLPEKYAEFASVEIEGKCDLGDNYLLLNKMNLPSGVFMFDGNGQMAWARLSDNFIKMVKLTERGTLLTLEDNMGNKFGDGNLILETTFTGDTLVRLEYGKKGFDRMAHHDVVLTKNLTYAFITNVNVDDVVVDGITEVNAYGTKVWEWDMADHVLPVKNGESFRQPWANSIELGDNGKYLISVRNLSQVWLLNPENGEVEMKFGSENQFGLNEDELFINQHHAQWIGENGLLLFDNGNIDSRPYSRIVKYRMNTINASASLVTDIQLPDELYSPYMGGVETYGEGFIITSSMSKKVAGFSRDGAVYWTMYFGDRMFRSQLVNKNRHFKYLVEN